MQSLNCSSCKFLGFLKGSFNTFMLYQTPLGARKKLHKRDFISFVLCGKGRMESWSDFQFYLTVELSSHLSRMTINKKNKKHQQFSKAKTFFFSICYWTSKIIQFIYFKILIDRSDISIFYIISLLIINHFCYYLSWLISH